ncbi:BTAD domain-containing putative transcriptional regulator [Desulforhopalus singaporensis]|uniref:Transcriptional activator domain-containing protein n=1 Tax=Desulforhopalus singaporensis TaxID=91360 RepID=A0A1H0NFT5_9BACT|nr:BTAD domain-containing putative transcriptional regulator [Desulforhopalus singaporensis]SDO91622.1 transcriptional activator domain-containing protein [Desulforhopalus singaporensis]
MCKTEYSLGRKVPSGKFWPPWINPEQSLIRSRLLQHKLPNNPYDKKLIYIEAQGGHGKTTLAAQFIANHNLLFAWYQVGPEDSDPFLLLSLLLRNLTTILDGFNAPDLQEIFNKGGAGLLDLDRCIEILFKNLNEYLKQDIYLVFDDLHLIQPGGLGHRFFEMLLDRSPPLVHFIFTTSHPVDIKCKTIRNDLANTYLGGDDLALDHREIKNLYREVFKTRISNQEAVTIRSLTSGWIMGVVILAGHQASGAQKLWQSGDINRQGSQQPLLTYRGSSDRMLDYFKKEIFARIPPYLHTTFIKLSFLHIVPASLAITISGDKDFDDLLISMSRDNSFIYRLDEHNRTFRFHHVFQEVLQQEGRARFLWREIETVFSLEADYWLRNNQIQRALTSHRNSNNWAAMEAILEEKGTELIACNRAYSVFALLQTIPENILFKHPWLLLFYGLGRRDHMEQTTLSFWSKACEMFIVSGDEPGELIALSQAIHYHFIISGNYAGGAKLLPRTEKLFEDNRQNLPHELVIMVARQLASGFCFFNSDMKKARHFIKLASRLAERLGIKNLIASTQFIHGCVHLFSGNRKKFLRKVELCFSLLNSPLVRETNRLATRMMHLCYLSMTGDDDNYGAHKLFIRENTHPEMVARTIGAPYLLIWESSLRFFKGEHLEGLELLETALATTAVAATSHMKSQVLQWQAFGLVLLNSSDSALTVINQANSLKNDTGGPFHRTFAKIITGAIQLRAGKYEQAAQNLERALTLAETISSTYLKLCALLNLSYLNYRTRSFDSARDYLKAGLCLMKSTGYNYCWTCEPVMLKQLLTAAVTADIEPVFAKELGRCHLKTAITGTGVSMPILTITMLDGFSVGIDGKKNLTSKDFTPFQRELLGLVVTAKSRRIQQEKIQLELWPDKAPDQARKSFDTLLTRLRKLISLHFEVPAKEYLVLKKGILYLNNYQIDALEFLEASRQGLSQSKNDNWWQAYNSFRKALNTWQSTLPEDTFQSEHALAFNDMLTDTLNEAMSVWAENLEKNDRIARAIEILERVHRINCLDERLTSILYRLYLEHNSPLRAKNLLEKYRGALIRAQYEKDEIEIFIKNLVLSFQE